MVEFIEIPIFDKQGKVVSKDKYPVRISHYIIEVASAELGRDLSAMEKGDTEAYELLLFYSLRAGALITQTEFKWKKEQMPMVIDLVFLDFIQLLPKFFGNMDEKKLQEVVEEITKAIPKQ